MRYISTATDPVFWVDYNYNAGRRKPVGVKHCQACHDLLMEMDRRHAVSGGIVRTRSVKLRRSEHARCLCGATQ